MSIQKKERPRPEDPGRLAADNSKGKGTKDSLKERIRTCQNHVTLDYSENDVIIFNELTEDNQGIYGTFYFGLATDKGEIITINLNRDQAEVMRDILDNYLKALEAHRRLAKEYPVKARRGVRCS